MNILTPKICAFKAPSETDASELEYYDRLHSEKCRDKDQTFPNHCAVTANNLASNEQHYNKIYDALFYHRFLPAGRIQAALGSTEREVSPFNCAVSQKIEDDMGSIMDALKNAAMILRLGTGIGYNFSHIRPKKALIKKLQTEASGPLSFMSIYDAMASTIASAGHRRGAMMGILNISHPDIEDFIDAKMVRGAYRQFNLSVGITDNFMEAVFNNKDWDLIFEGEIYKTLPAKYLWEKIIKNAYYSAEPGIIFIDRLNQNNNLYYCEEIESTNPCSEQPLPPYGLCCLGSFNLVAYILASPSGYSFDYSTLIEDIRTFVEAYDNIFDKSIYAIPEHRDEAISKRRIGLGFTGIANTIEILIGRPSYGEQDFCKELEKLSQLLTIVAYDKSADLARERGPFRLYSPKYLNSNFIKTLPQDLQDKIAINGIRNSHLISYAPCGTISQYAWNTSSGVEPVFYHSVDRDVYMKSGKVNVTLKDFAVRHYNFYGKTLEECSIEDHLNVAGIIQKYTDSAVSKTVNVASTCPYEEYEQVYAKAFTMGLKGITVFRPTELRGSVITKSVNKVEQKLDSQEVENIVPVYGSCKDGVCTM